MFRRSVLRPPNSIPSHWPTRLSIPRIVIASPIPAGTYPAPTDIPMAATIQIVAAVVVPWTPPAPFNSTPPPRKPIPVTICAASPSRISGVARKRIAYHRENARTQRHKRHSPKPGRLLFPFALNSHPPAADSGEERTKHCRTRPGKKQMPTFKQPAHRFASKNFFKILARRRLGSCRSRGQREFGFRHARAQRT